MKNPTKLFEECLQEDLKAQFLAEGLSQESFINECLVIQDKVKTFRQAYNEAYTKAHKNEEPDFKEVGAED